MEVFPLIYVIYIIRCSVYCDDYTLYDTPSIVTTIHYTMLRQLWRLYIIRCSVNCDDYTLYDAPSIVTTIHYTMLRQLWRLCIIRRSVNCDDYSLYDAPSIVTTMHRREQTIYLQLINKQNKKNSKKKELRIYIYKRIYRMENCLDVVGLDLWFKLIQRRSRDNIGW
jgi:hypothetical protein